MTPAEHTFLQAIADYQGICASLRAQLAAARAEIEELKAKSEPTD